MAELDGDFEGHTVPGRVFDSNGNTIFHSFVIRIDMTVIFVLFYSLGAP